MTNTIQKKQKYYKSYLVPVIFPITGSICEILSRGRILGRNPDKSLKSFPPFYSQSPYSFASRFWFIFFKLMQPLTDSTVQLLYTVKEKGGKPDKKPHLLPFGLRNPYRNLKSENSQERNLNEIERSWIRLAEVSQKNAVKHPPFLPSHHTILQNCQT